MVIEQQGEKEHLDKFKVKNDEIPLRVMNLYCNGEDFWFTAANINGLFKMNRKSLEPEFIGSFPGYTPWGCCMYYGMAQCNDNLYLAPFAAKEIAVVNMNTRRCHTIEFEDIKEELNPPYLRRWKFIDAIAYQGNIFFIPGSYPAILKLDVETEEITYITDWIAQVEPYIAKTQRLYWTKACIIENKIYAVGQRANLILEFDMESCNSKVHEVGKDGDCFSAVWANEGCLWLAPKHDGEIISWNIETHEVLTYGKFPEGYERKQYEFNQICCTEEKVWLFPNHAEFTFFMDVKEGVFRIAKAFQSSYEKIPISKREEQGRIYSTVCYDVKKYENTIYAYMYQNCTIIAYDTLSGERSETRCVCSKENIKKFRRPSYLKRDYVSLNEKFFTEDASYDLEGYLNYVGQYEHKS